MGCLDWMTHSLIRKQTKIIISEMSSSKHLKNARSYITHFLQFLKNCVFTEASWHLGFCQVLSNFGSSFRFIFGSVRFKQPGNRKNEDLSLIRKFSAPTTPVLFDFIVYTMIGLAKGLNNAKKLHHVIYQLQIYFMSRCIELIPRSPVFRAA